MTNPIDTTIKALRPIFLDDLVRRAGLLTRMDRKYIVPVADLPFVLAGLPADARVLEIDGRRAFGYRSAYFDTPHLDSYLDAAHRRRRRFKVRVRSYLDTDLHFLEIKTRGRRGTTVKQRVPYTGDGQRLGPDDREHADAVLANAGIRRDGPPLRLSLITRYRRRTLFIPSAGNRVTIDTALAWTLPDGTTMSCPDRAIVETKSGQAASEVDRLLWSLRHRPCSVSKYATGLAALRPDLPANRWLPVLRRHFDTVAFAPLTEESRS